MKSVRYCFSASSAMPEEAAKQWESKFGIKIDEGYGMTETSPQVCYTQWKRKVGSVGPSIPDVEIRIADPDGNEVPRGERGEILVKGPNVFKEYYRNPEETANAFINGWMRTGDIAYMDEEGFVFVVDRVKDMINSAGLKIWPREVEETLYKHPDVKECAVFGIPHPIFGETPVAAIVGKTGAKPDKDGILAYCKEHMSDYKVPKHVIMMEELPRSHTGKILKGDLKEEAGKIIKNSQSKA
jgi:long-chain acyl-CoA synthetase